ncbi:MAG: hypothetical protein WAT39_24470 [Planctomycetota bacterium]
MRFRLPPVLALLLLAACGSSHPLAGHWSPEGQQGPVTVGIDFDADSDAVMAHVDGPDGHSHPPKGTYTFDAATKAVTVKCKLMGDGKADTWTGTLNGDALELTGGEVKLKVRRGGSAH